MCTVCQRDRRVNVRLKIISWNIAGGHRVGSDKHFDYLPEEPAYFADHLAELEPDIICLQETHTNARRSLAEDLAQRIGFPFVFDTPASPSHVDQSYQLGNAIISRLRLEKTQSVQYPYPETEEPLRFKSGRLAAVHHKKLQLARVGQIWMANTQLLPLPIFSHSYDHGAGLVLAQQINSIYAKLPRPLIFAGDFNYKTPLVRYPSLSDMQEALPDKITRPWVSEDDNRPDHIFTSTEFTVVDGGVIQTETDHFLCWTELEYRREHESH